MPTHHMQFGTLAILILACSNLCLIILAVFDPWTEYPLQEEKLKRRRARTFGLLSLSLVAGSQLLYLAFSAAWFYQLLSFYPGSNYETVAILFGLSLCIGSFASAIFGSGFRRWAAVCAATISGALWLLSPVASLAV